MENELTERKRRPGKSQGKCYVCGKKFTIRKQTKHSKKVIRAICDDCASKQRDAAKKK